MTEQAAELPSVVADPSVPPGVVEFRDGDRVVGRIFTPDVREPMPAAETGELDPLAERESRAYRAARRRLRLLHTELAGRRQDWANNIAQPCSSARAVAYQSAMQSIHSIIDEIEAIAAGLR